MLGALHLRQESVSIAGGIVLFLIGVRMIFPAAEGNMFGRSPGGEPFIVPMAIPGVAGPSAMAALLLAGKLRSPAARLTGAWRSFSAWLATAVILLSSTYLFRCLATAC